MKEMKTTIFYDSHKTGTCIQIEALVQGLGLKYDLYPIQLPKPWCWLTPYLFTKLPIWIQKNLPLPPQIIENLPPIIFASGHQAFLCALSIRHRCHTVVLLNPTVSCKYFDLVIAPLHDKLSKYDNVIEFAGSLHSITPGLLQQYQTNIFHNLPKPYLSVLLGGNNKHFTYNKDVIKKLYDDIKMFRLNHKEFASGSVLITPSRRTPIHCLNFLKQLVDDIPHFIWDNKGDNPYKYMLSQSDTIIVTGDSINMVSEACATGKSVLIYELPMHCKKFKHFFNTLYKNNHAQPFSINDKLKHTVVLQEKDRILELVKKKIEALLKS